MSRKGKDLYYLLPGMGRAARRRRRRNQIISLVVGSMAAAAVGGLMYWLHTK